MENKLNETVSDVKYIPKDFSNQDVKWCPGCGDYSILSQVQKHFPILVKGKKTLFGFPVSDVQAVFLITWELMASIVFMEELPL